MKRLALVCFLLCSGVSAWAVDLGSVAPNAPLKELAGTEPGKLSGIADYKGNLVYLDFWASWCGPCRQSLPIMNKIREQYAEYGFEVVAVNVDENLDDALGFLEQYPVSYPVLLDPEGKMPAMYDVQGMPTAYLIDRKGVIIYKHEGFKKSDEAKIEAMIKENL